jgi:dolichyl-diphosphooligosaccharide--protein glycosyltransferase
MSSPLASLRSWLVALPTRLPGGSGPDGDGDHDRDRDPLTLFVETVHVPILLGVAVWMAAVRLVPADAARVDGRLLLSGSDAWYHLRQVSWTVAHFPATQQFDPWTNYPTGTSVGQFGTPFDQAVAAAALAVGLGDPDPATVRAVLATAPVVAGALTVLPTYALAARLRDRRAGLLAAGILALLPGTFLRRTLFAAADHNAVEPLLQVTAVLAVAAALDVADETVPVAELVTGRDWGPLRRPAVAAGLAGLAIGGYLHVWPPGVLLVGIIAVAATLWAVGAVRAGRPPEPALLVVAGIGLAAAAVVGPGVETLAADVSTLSSLHLLATLGLAGGALALARLARAVDARGLDPDWYPPAILAAGVVGVGLLVAFAPAVASLVARNLRRVLLFDAGAGTRTIGEAQPFLDPARLQYGISRVDLVVREYGTTLALALVGAAARLWWPLRTTRAGRLLVAGTVGVVGVAFGAPGVLAALSGAVGLGSATLGVLLVAPALAAAAAATDRRAAETLVIVWFGVLLAAAFTQVRFNYYLAVAVAVLAGDACARGLALAGVPTLATLVGVDGSAPVDGNDDPDDRTVASRAGGRLRAALGRLETRHVLALAAVGLVCSPVLVVPVSIGTSGSPALDRTNTAPAVAAAATPGDVTAWTGALRYLRTGTPPEGRGDGAGPAMDYRGRVSRHDDFSYPAGAYGVLAWWDYGHWIETIGRRIPVANPFQQGAERAAATLLAPTESAALSALDRGTGPTERVRYVMVDWTAATPASGKYAAPTAFADDVAAADLSTRLYAVANGRLRRVDVARTQRHYRSLRTRLYRHHGSAFGPRTADGDVVVLDWATRRGRTADGESVEVRTLPGPDTGRGTGSAIRRFPNLSAAEAYVARDGSARVGGVGPYPRERVPALERFRLVHATARSATESDRFRALVTRRARLTGLSPSQLVATRPAWVKTFERVPGARVVGRAAPNATVVAAVEVAYGPATGTGTGTGTGTDTFTYRQRATAGPDGRFELRVPYATTGLSGCEPTTGCTDVRARPTGPFRLRSTAGGRATLSVPEAAVTTAGGDPLRVTVRDPTGGDERGPSVAPPAPTAEPTGDAGSKTGTETRTVREWTRSIPPSRSLTARRSDRPPGPIRRDGQNGYTAGVRARRRRPSPVPATSGPPPRLGPSRLDAPHGPPTESDAPGPQNRSRSSRRRSSTSRSCIANRTSRW